MNKMTMAIGVVAIAGAMSGCSIFSGAADEDKVATWQKERTPVEVLKSQISVKAAGAIVEALDIVPFGLYKAVADKVDKAAVMERYRRIYLGYVADIQAMEKAGKSRAEAIKEEMSKLKSMENGAETIAKLNEYLKVCKETSFDAIADWIKKMGEEITAASQKFAQETPNALSQIVDIAKKEGGMAVITIPKQGKDDLAVIGGQLKDAGVGLSLYIEMVNADKEAAKVQADYPVEG